MGLSSTPTVNSEPGLYDNDNYSWALEQARALRERRADLLDWNNLAEEVGDLAGRQADALKSHYESLIEHLLKQSYAPQHVKRGNSRLWRLSVRNTRRRIRDLLKSNPGLKNRCAELFAQAWPYARDSVLGALNLEDATIPESPLWTLDQALADDFEAGRVRK